jgi:fimbrial chaperone protein
MMTLSPGEERRMRVAVTATPGEVERTYRIFIEELPPPKNEPDGSNGVQVLTRVGIPIFVAPVKTSAQATVSGVGLAQVKKTRMMTSSSRDISESLRGLG